MTAQHENVLSLEQLDAFRTAFHEGAAEIFRLLAATPFASAPSFTSTSATEAPWAAKVCAMPLPIVPAPMTATRSRVERLAIRPPPR